MDDLIDDDGPLGGPARPGRNEGEYTVSEISGAVKRTLEDSFGRIRVRGEIGRIFKARSGHLYYDVKDDRNVLSCTTWRGQIAGLSVQPEEGMEVVVTGKLSGFGAQSKYTLNVDAMEVAGRGALLAMLEKRRAKLAAEGLFDPSRKMPLPFLPHVIGVVTSPQGAVIRDILHRLADRFPRDVLIWPVAVQGRACAPEVAAAIRGFDALDGTGPIPRPDLLIVARGGGSIEDLWGFNEEAVVRAVSACRIPLISAVGHETDTTLIDHVADRRAPTPTAAAEMAVPVRADLAATVAALGARQARAAALSVRARGQRLADLSRGLPRAEALLDRPRGRIDALSHRLPAALTARVSQARLRLGALSGRLVPGDRLTRERARLDDLSRRLDGALRDRHRAARQGLSTQAAGLERLARRGFVQPRIAFAAQARRLTSLPLTRRAARDGQRLDATLRRLALAARSEHARRVDRLAALERLRVSLGYERTLERGFAVVWAGAQVVTDAEAARAARQIQIQFAEGPRVEAVTEGSAAPRKRPKPGPKDQGSLF